VEEEEGGDKSKVQLVISNFVVATFLKFLLNI
jgi:hypothetical protein